MMGYIVRKGAVWLSIMGVLLLLFGYNALGLFLMYLAIVQAVVINWWPSEDFEKLVLLYQTSRQVMMKLWAGITKGIPSSVVPYFLLTAGVVLYWLLVKLGDKWFAPPSM